MRGLVLCLALIGTLASWAVPVQAREATPKPPPWMERVPAPRPGSFPPPRPCHATWRVTWSGIPAGTISATFSRSNRLHVSAGSRTTGFARSLFRLDATMESSLDRRTLLPGQTILTETYSDEKRTTTLSFDPTRVSRTRRSQPAHRDDGRPRIQRLPHVFDLHGALLYLRSQSLAQGTRHTLLVYGTGSPYLVTASVEGRETIRVPAGKFPAIRLGLQLESINKKLQLQPYRKARQLQAWLGDDANRLLLKARGELFIGAVSVELDSVSFP